MINVIAYSPVGARPSYCWPMTSIVRMTKDIFLVPLMTILTGQLDMLSSNTYSFITA